MRKSGISSYFLPCEGVSKTKINPLADHPAWPSVTVFKDGARAVGCPRLDKNDLTCRIGLQKVNERCIQLFPVRSDQALNIIKPPLVADGKPLTNDERILLILTTYPGELITREAIELAIWESRKPSSLDNALRRLKKQLHPDAFTVVRGKGIIYNPPTE